MMMAMTWFRGGVLGVLCGFGVMSVIAQGPPPDTGRSAALIEKYDRNADGVLSAAEIESARPVSVAGVGVAPDLERQLESGSKLAKSRTAIGNDAEMQALFDQFDVNRNGALDGAEMDALRKSRKRQS